MLQQQTKPLVFVLWRGLAEDLLYVTNIAIPSLLLMVGNNLINTFAQQHAT